MKFYYFCIYLKCFWFCFFFVRCCCFVLFLKRKSTTMPSIKTWIIKKHLCPNKLYYYVHLYCQDKYCNCLSAFFSHELLVRLICLAKFSSNNRIPLLLNVPFCLLNMFHMSTWNGGAIVNSTLLLGQPFIVVWIVFFFCVKSPERILYWIGFTFFHPLLYILKFRRTVKLYYLYLRIL